MATYVDGYGGICGRKRQHHAARCEICGQMSLPYICCFFGVRPAPTLARYWKTDVDTCCHQMQLFAVCRERWGAYTGTAFLRAPPWQAWPDTRLTLSGVSQDGSRRGKTRSARVRLGFEMLTFKYVRSRSSFGSRKRPLATYLVIRYL